MTIVLLRLEIVPEPFLVLFRSGTTSDFKTFTALALHPTGIAKSSTVVVKANLMLTAIHCLLYFYFIRLQLSSYFVS